MSDSFLELRNLKKSFTSEEYVLQGINLQIDQGEFVTSFPSSHTLPLSGCSSPAMMRRVVVLPQPEAPSKVTNSP